MKHPSSTGFGKNTRFRLLSSLLVVAGIGAIGFGLASLRAAAGDITLSNFVTNFNSPIGIDFHEDTAAANGLGDLIASVNYPTGGNHNLDLIAVPSGAHTQFSPLVGLTQELKIATVRNSPGCQTFPVGDVFTGNGVPGEIVRIKTDGTIYPPAGLNPGATANSWVKLPGETDLLRGSLYVDRFCAFGGELIVVTGDENVTGGGAVWRVLPTGEAHLVATIPNTHLEGLITLPNDPKYGPWAGTILAGAEGDAVNLTNPGLVYSITAAGVATSYALVFTDTQGIVHPMKPEDLDLIEAGQDFFGVNYGQSRVLRAPAAELAPFVGDILLTQEMPCGSKNQFVTANCAGLPANATTSGLYAIHYVGTGGNAAGGLFRVTPFTFTAGSVTIIDQWEHVTMAPLTAIPVPLTSGDTATIGFWQNKNGQAVINCVNGGSTSVALGNYLATKYPSLFGSGPGTLGNLAGKTNAQIAAIYLGSTYFGAGGQKVNAQILGVALATYVTSSTLSGATNCGAKFGFNFSAAGTGTKTYNVGSLGTAIGLSNNTSYTILQLLKAANDQKAAGTFNANAFNTIFDAINNLGDI